jgi:hypothetical protein
MTAGFGSSTVKKAVLANEDFVILSGDVNSNSGKLKISYVINKGSM